MEKLKSVAIIQARLNSSRLPGKVLYELGGYPMIVFMIERIKRSKLIDEIVVATTINSEDDEVQYIAEKSGVSFFRGSEDDVLGRVVGAVESIQGDIIVEIMGDCPLLDPQVVDYVLDHYLKKYPKYDYVSNNGLGNLERHFIPLGMDVQVFSFRDLKYIESITNNSEDREHPSLYFYRTGKNKYSLKNVPIPNKWKRDYKIRLTLDTINDYRVIDCIYKNLYNIDRQFNLEDIFKFIDNNRDLININNKIQQRMPKDCE